MRTAAAKSIRTWRALFDDARRRLGDEGDARRIVERASGGDAGWWHLSLDEQVPERALPFVEDMVRRRAAGEPLQYVVGRWGFRTLDLYVDRRVLIPRPETEQVVEVALERARDAAALAGRPLAVADLGTGSGAIALALATELPGAHVWATERSPGALAVARANLAGVGGQTATRVRLFEGSWFEPLPADLRGHLDVVVSNPPYVASDEELPPEVADWEPPEALVSGPTGLEAVTEILGTAGSWLAGHGSLVMEIAPHQAAEVRRLAAAAGFASVEVRPDLTQRERVLAARRA